MHTDFDIIEEGNVPLLMSLAQVRNLRFSLSLKPEEATLVSPAFGTRNIHLETATSRQLVFLAL